MRLLAVVASCIALTGAPAVSLAGGGIAPPPTAGHYVVYPTPFGGTRVGGSMTVAAGGRSVSSLRITFPPPLRDICPAAVDVVGTLALHNLTGANRYKIHISDWFFGRWSSPNGNLQPERVTLEASGKRFAGELTLVL